MFYILLFLGPFIPVFYSDTPSWQVNANKEKGLWKINVGAINNNNNYYYYVT